MATYRTHGSDFTWQQATELIELVERPGLSLQEISSLAAHARLNMLVTVKRKPSGEVACKATPYGRSVAEALRQQLDDDATHHRLSRVETLEDDDLVEVPDELTEAPAPAKRGG